MAAKMFGFVTGLISFMLLCVHMCNSQAPDGGASGGGVNQYLTGKPNTDKIQLGLNCVKDTSSSTQVKIEMYVNQGDDAFKYLPSSSTVRAGELVTYEKCYLINAADFDATKNVKAANAHANCDNSVDFTPLDTSTATSVEYKRRTKIKTLVVPDPSQTAQYQCGSRKVGTTIEIAVYCKRDAGFDKDLDVVFIATYSTAGCTAIAVTPSPVKVKDPNQVEVKYDIEVTMKAYLRPNVGVPVNGPESPTANEIPAAGVALGTLAYLEVCTKIPKVTTATVNDINNQFFLDGVSPIAFLPHSCTAAADIANQAFSADVEAMTTWPTLVDAKGCGAAGTGASADKGLAEYFSSNVYIWKWAETTPKVANSHVMSPNCLRTEPFPLVTFKRLIATDSVNTIYNCKVKPCNSGTDRECFGNRAGGALDYPTCTATGRKKRETINVGPGLPSEVSVSVRIIMPGANATSTSDKFDGCFEKKTFIGLTSALVALLAAVLIAAVFLSVKLSTSAPESTTDSMTGIENKAYY